MWGNAYWGNRYWGTPYWGKVGSGSSSAPLCTFRFSGDGANTWSANYVRSMGLPGEYKKRVFCNRIGTFSDFVVEMSGSDPIKIAITGASMDLEVLRSQSRGVILQTGPPMTLRVSYDGGNTWSAGYTRSMGNAGEFLAVCAWNRPGMARDCVIEVSGIDPIKIALTGANFDAEVSKG